MKNENLLELHIKCLGPPPLPPTNTYILRTSPPRKKFLDLRMCYNVKCAVFGYYNVLVIAILLETYNSIFFHQDFKMLFSHRKV